MVTRFLRDYLEDRRDSLEPERSKGSTECLSLFNIMSNSRILNSYILTCTRNAWKGDVPMTLFKLSEVQICNSIPHENCFAKLKFVIVAQYEFLGRNPTSNSFIEFLHYIMMYILCILVCLWYYIFDSFTKEDTSSHSIKEIHH